MSFFADMIAGGLAGAGKGMSDYAVMQEREDDKRAQLEAQMQLKREMLADQLASRKEIAEMRYGQGGSGQGTGGSGGGAGKGFNLVQMALDEQDPAKLDRLLKVAYMVDRHGGAALANALGRPIQEQVATQAPTTGDLARFDRGEQSSIPELTTSSRAVSYDENKGAIALQRMYALFLDPAKADNQANAERQWTQNDFGIAGAQQVRKDGGDAVDAAEAFGTLSNPKLNTSRNDVDLQKMEAQDRRQESIDARAKADREAREKNATVEDARKTWQALLKDGTDKKSIDAAYTHYLELRATPVAAPQAAAPKYPYKGRSPADAAAAYKGK